MTEITTVGLDLAKSVFQVHGTDEDGRPVMRKKWHCQLRKHVPVHTTGRVNYRHLVTKCD